MAHEKPLETLRRVPILADLSPAELQFLSERAVRKACGTFYSTRKAISI